MTAEPVPEEDPGAVPDLRLVDAMSPERRAARRAQYRRRETEQPGREPDPPASPLQRWEGGARGSEPLTPRRASAASAGGSQIAAAAMYGFLFHPRAGHSYSYPARHLVAHLASTKGGQWSVNGPRSLPLSVLARRLDMSERTLDRAIAELQDEDGPHGGPVIEVDHEDVGRRVPKVVYRLTDPFRRAAQDYAVTVVGPTATGCKDIYRRNPAARLEEIAAIKASGKVPPTVLHRRSGEDR